jgi:hypothetical protein
MNQINETQNTELTVLTPKTKTTKYTNSIDLYVALDAEWGVENNNKPICYQTAILDAAKTEDLENNRYTTITLNSQIPEIPKYLQGYENTFNLVEYRDLENDEQHLSKTILSISFF